MSADNGLYICEDPQGKWHVAYGAAIDNLDYHPEGSREEEEEWQSYFGGPEKKDEYGPRHFDSKEPAILAAHEMEEKHSYLEYGVSVLRKSPVVIKTT